VEKHHKDRHHLARGVGLIMVAVFMFSAMDTMAKLALKSYPIAPLIWARYTLQLVIMVALFAPRMGLGLARTKFLGLQMLRGILLVGSTACFYLSLKFLPLAEAAAISFVAPVLVTAFSGHFLRERVSRRQWAAVCLGFVGVLIIIRPGGSVFTLAVAMPLATAVLFSLYQIATRKVAGLEHPLTTLFFGALAGAVVTTLMLPVTWQTPTPTQGALMVGIGCLGGFGHFLLIRAVEHASPMALSPFVYVQLIWSTGLAWIVFGDFPDHGTLTGMAVIVSAGLLAVNWQQLRAGAVAPPRPAERPPSQE